MYNHLHHKGDVFNNPWAAHSRRGSSARLCCPVCHHEIGEENDRDTWRDKAEEGGEGVLETATLICARSM